MRKSSLLLITGTGAVATCVGAAAAVLTIQALAVLRSVRPAVPGPHLQDGLVPAPSGTETPLSMVWLGDSLAAGVGAETSDASFPSKTAAAWSVTEDRSVQLTCLACPGAHAADVLADQVPAAIRRLGPGAVAVVTVGSNDVGSFRSPWGFRRDYQNILRSLSASGASVVAVGLPHIGSAAVMARPLRTIVGWVGRHADRQIRRLALANGAQYVHIAIRAPWGTKPKTYLAADKWHPNDATYQLWADRFATRLTRLAASQAQLTSSSTRRPGRPPL